MRPSRPVFWYSGQFLDPQHFQEADRRHDQQLAAAWAASRPWPWGVGGLELDEADLAGGRVTVTRADLLFPDGTRAVVEGREGNAVIESRDVAEIWPGRHEPLSLRVGLRKLTPKHNVAGVLAPGAALPPGEGRYLAAEADEMLADRYALPHLSLSDSGAPVRTLYYYLRLFSPEECRSRGDYYHFPILRLKDQGLGVRLDPQCCPPLIRLAAHPAMTRAATAFETRLAALVSHLAPERAESLHTAAPGNLAALLSAAAMALADLRLLLARPDAQPWELFGLLSRSLAALSAVLKSPGDLPALSGAFPFDHDSPLESLAALELPFQKLLARILPEISAELPFTLRDNLLVAALSDTASMGNAEAFIVLKTEAPAGELLARGLLLAGSPDDVREALHRAVPALPLSPVKAPAGLPEAGGLVYLKAPTESPAWGRVLAAGELAVALLTEGPKADLAAGSRLIFIKAAGPC